MKTIILFEKVANVCCVPKDHKFSKKLHSSNKAEKILGNFQSLILFLIRS